MNTLLCVGGALRMYCMHESDREKGIPILIGAWIYACKTSNIWQTMSNSCESVIRQEERCTTQKGSCYFLHRYHPSYLILWKRGLSEHKQPKGFLFAVEVPLMWEYAISGRTWWRPRAIHIWMGQGHASRQDNTQCHHIPISDKVIVEHVCNKYVKHWGQKNWGRIKWRSRSNHNWRNQNTTKYNPSQREDCF